MGYTLDYFVAALQCPVCGTISAADSSTNMQTKIRSQPSLAYLGIGHALEIQLQDMENRGYLLIRSPRSNEAIRILETWDCPSCGTSFNWAEVVLQNGIIQSINSIPLTREVLERAHFISEDCVYIVANILNQPAIELSRTDIVQLLQKHL